MFLTIGGLLVIALFSALIAPVFIDWTAYKQSFEREASRIVGQPVTVSGTASVRILPLPSVTFTDLSVGRYEDGSPMMTVDAFSMNTELMPFLRGEVRIVDLQLDAPKLSIRVSENGTIAWTARKQVVVNPDNVTLEKMQVSNGSIHIEGLAGGRVITGSDFDALVTAQSLYGPWRVDADGNLGGAQTQLEITTGRLQESGTLRVRAAASRSDQPYRLTADGPVSVVEDLLEWDGEFQLIPITESTESAPDVDMAAALPLVADGRFNATPDGVNVPEYRVEIGDRADPYTITGNGQLNIREEIYFTAIADGRQIDLDRLEGNPELPLGKGTSLDRRLAVLRDLVDRIPIPLTDGEVEFSLPAIVAGDTVIREITANVRPDLNGWLLQGMRAVLPGNTVIEADGKLGTRSDFGFTGQMLLASRQPTGFANWLSGRTNASLRRLKTAGFGADVTITGNQATFDNLELVLDEVMLRGKIQRLAPFDSRAAIIADMSGENINLDDLRAIYALTQSGDETEALTNHDLDIKLRAGTLEAQGFTARDVDARLRVEAGSVSVDSLNAGDFYGAEIRSSGKLANLLEKPSGNFGLSVQAADGTKLVELGERFLGENRFFEALRTDRALVSNVDLTISLDARPQAEGSRGTITITGTAGDTRISLRDRFEGQLTNLPDSAHDLTIQLSQPSPQLLARQLSLPVLPLDAPGPVTLSAELIGVAGEGLKTLIAANTPGTDLSASGVVRLPKPASAAASQLSAAEFDLDLTFGSQDIDPWLLLAGYPLPGSVDATPASLSANLTKKEAQYRFKEASGQYAGIPFRGSVLLDLKAQPRPKVSGQLAMGFFSLPLMAVLTLGEGTLPISGVDSNSADFTTPFLTGLDVELELEAKAADFGAAERAQDYSGKLNFVAGEPDIPEFEAQWLGGKVTGSLALKNVSGSAVTTIRLGGEALDADKLAALGGFGSGVSGKANISAGLDANGRNFREMVSTLTGSGLVELVDARIEGISTGDLDDILAVTDAEDFEIESEPVREIVISNLLVGDIEVPAFTSAFSVTQGRISLRNAVVQDDGGSLTGSASYSLGSGEAEFSATVFPDPGEEALEGADPETTFSWRGNPGALERHTDTTALQGYLSLRALEREQRRIEILQASVLEKQRLRREVEVSNTRIASRTQERQRDLRVRDELRRKEENSRLEREAREKVQQEAEEEAARIKVEEEAAQQAAEEAERQRVEAAEAQPQNIIPQPRPAQTPAAREPANQRPAIRQRPSGNLFENLQKLFGNN